MGKTRYIWDPVSDTYLMEKDEAGSTTAVYTNEPGKYGPLISQHREDETRYYHFDAQNSTRELTDESENVTDTYTYTAFGETAAKTGTTDNPFGYKGALGYYVDGAMETTYVRARDYVKSIGRWASVDPSGLLAGTNLYGYAGANPILLVDPSGLEEECGCCCCVETTEMIHKRLEKKEPAQFTNWWGHYLTHRATLKFVRGQGRGLGCRIEWFECSNIKGSLGQEPGKWFPVHTNVNLKDVDTDWDDYYRGEKSFKCPGGDLTLTFGDQPKELFPLGRTVKFAIRASSDPNCDCSQDGIAVVSITEFGTQRLLAKEDAFFNPLYPTIQEDQYVKWEFGPGISDSEEPKKCTKEKIEFAQC